MRKRLIQSILVMMILALPLILSAEFQYLTEEEYRELSSDEREAYNERLIETIRDYEDRKAGALHRQETLEQEVAELQKRLDSLNGEYDQVYAEIKDFLGLTPSDYQDARQKIQYFNSQVDRWEKLSDTQLWEYNKQVTALIDSYRDYQKTRAYKIPDFQDEFTDLDRRIIGLERSLERAKPKYVEDEYTVKGGDYLSKISGYDFIYNDPSKWGIIYRANRDQIKNPNVIHVNQVLKIPRGLPTTWKVYRGEFLWKIASYPEVYNNGARWPEIYRANKDQIKDPNLIYPNQILEIPRD